MSSVGRLSLVLELLTKVGQTVHDAGHVTRTNVGAAPAPCDPPSIHADLALDSWYSGIFWVREIRCYHLCTSKTYRVLMIMFVSCRKSKPEAPRARAQPPRRVTRAGALALLVFQTLHLAQATASVSMCASRISLQTHTQVSKECAHGTT